MNRAPKDFTFGEAEELIASVLYVRPEDRAKLRSSLRHLRTIGVPKVPNLGSGIKSRYSEDQVFEMLMTVGIEFAGQMPRRAAQLAQEIINGWRHNEYIENPTKGIYLFSPEQGAGLTPGEHAKYFFLADKSSNLEFDAQQTPPIVTMINVGILWSRFQSALGNG